MYTCTCVHMKMYTAVRMHICSDVQLYIPTCVRMYLRMYEDLCMRTYVQMYIRTDAHLRICTYVHMHLRTSACMICAYIHKHIYIHMYICIHTHVHIHIDQYTHKHLWATTLPSARTFAHACACTCTCQFTFAMARVGGYVWRCDKHTNTSRNLSGVSPCTARARERMDTRFVGRAGPATPLNMETRRRQSKSRARWVGGTGKEITSDVQTPLHSSATALIRNSARHMRPQVHLLEQDMLRLETPRAMSAACRCVAPGSERGQSHNAETANLAPPSPPPRHPQEGVNGRQRGGNGSGTWVASRPQAFCAHVRWVGQSRGSSWQAARHLRRDEMAQQIPLDNRMVEVDCIVEHVRLRRNTHAPILQALVAPLHQRPEVVDSQCPRLAKTQIHRLRKRDLRRQPLVTHVRAPDETPADSAASHRQGGRHGRKVLPAARRLTPPRRAQRPRSRRTASGGTRPGGGLVEDIGVPSLCTGGTPPSGRCSPSCRNGMLPRSFPPLTTYRTSKMRARSVSK